MMVSMALLLGSSAAVGQTRVAVAVTGELQAVLELQGDPVRGKAVFEDCAGCHRKDASGRASGAVPRMSGQHAPVILKQIVDIRAGLRLNPPMKPHVDDPELNLQAFADVASYLQAMPISGPRGKGPGRDVARGQSLYDQDCAACHGSRGEGRAETFYPMLTAQHYSYLLRELGLIRDGRRGNSNPEMVRRVKNYAQDDLEAVADYLARLPPPKK